MIKDFKIEELEKRYLDYIVTSLRQDLTGLIKGLNSRIKILNDWKNEFLRTARAGYNASDLDAGAERIFHHPFTPTNPDYRGKVQLGRNQISYEITEFKPNLPSLYKSIGLPTLTYIIQIVHEHMSPKINALNVICIPNGQLLKYYGNKILQAGKGGWLKATDIRYNYAKEPYFILLKKRYNREIFRIEVLALDKNFSIKELTGKELSITPYRRIG